MRFRLSEIKTDIDTSREMLPLEAARILGIDAEDFTSFEIRRKSVDSRKKPRIFFVYTVEFEINGKAEARIAKRKIKGLSKILDNEIDSSKEHSDDDITEDSFQSSQRMTSRPLVVGTGPAGLFAALELASAGLKPIIIERGPNMESRIKAVYEFKKNKILNPEANMLFGEGGAGTFSDGKLATGIKDSLIRRVLREFRDAGAGEEIMYLAKPHIGTDVLRSVIVNIRKKIEELGGEFRFGTRLESLIEEDARLKGVKLASVNAENQVPKGCSGPGDTYILECDALVLAVGHSARDTFKMLHDEGIEMQQKPFSIGVRIEHSQDLINSAQYGEENLKRCTDAVSAEVETGKLPPADYKLSYKASNGRGVYSFCMCPGGEVVVCSTEDGSLFVNGMSSRARNSGVANSGILCDVRTSDFDSDDVLAGVRFQDKYERLAYKNGGGNFAPPACSMEDFLRRSKEDCGDKAYESGSNADAVMESLPAFAYEAIKEAIPEFARKIKGYDDPSAIVTAVETRSSSPVKILRGDDGQSNIKGIFPAGEGAGYAGGITSAACDGIRAARKLIKLLELYMTTPKT